MHCGKEKRRAQRIKFKFTISNWKTVLMWCQYIWLNAPSVVSERASKRERESSVFWRYQAPNFGEWNKWEKLKQISTNRKHHVKCFSNDF